jgi:hypothetical protein
VGACWRGRVYSNGTPKFFESGPDLWPDMAP